MASREPFFLNDLPKLSRRKATQFRNKTVPLYLPFADGPRRGLEPTLPIIIYNYIYRRWFRPYRTSIDQGQCIIKIINPSDQPLTPDLDSAVSSAMRMHTVINTRLDSIEADPFYTTLPLFRAMMIVVPGQSYPTCDDLRNITKMSVLVMATGEQGGLSAPITFDLIANGAKLIHVGGLSGVETDLETAIEFVMSLEKREEAAFGPSLTQSLHWGVIKTGTRIADLTQTDWDGGETGLSAPVQSGSIPKDIKHGLVVVPMSMLA